MGWGVKKHIDRKFADVRLVTNLTIQKRDRTIHNFGYEPPTEDVTSKVEIKVVPANYVMTDQGMQKFGTLEEGDLRFFCSADVAIDFNDEGSQAIFNGETFDVKSIRGYWLGNELVAKIIVIHNSLTR